jgi:pyruvate,orthophosphate dikinase
MPEPERWNNVYLLGCGAAEQRSASAEILGHKAANLIRMAEAGLPVPPGFVLATPLCREYFDRGHRLPDGFTDLRAQRDRDVEKATGLTFGGERRPLLVSVRSGAAVSMPGMMDTILNIGLSDRTLLALIRTTGNPRHAWDSYRRLIQTYAEVVHQVPADPFERSVIASLEREAVPSVVELNVAALKGLTQEFLGKFESQAGQPFPQDPLAQLAGATEAVFRSWESLRATEYRRLHGLDNRAGTAVTVQAMVFGNMGGTSGSGVAFTRDPATGENALYLDFLWNAQGEDVVSGRYPAQDPAGLQEAMPELFHELCRTGKQLEMLFRDAQDIEFTVQEGRLFLLQSRDAKRTPWAALRTTCDLVKEGLIDEATALKRLDPFDLDSIQSLRPVPKGDCRPLCSGTPAGPGVAVGEIALDSESAVAMAAAGRTPILVREDIAPADFAGLSASAGILTGRGGRTSHAAVVARQLNKVCIVGCRQLAIPASSRGCRLDDRWFSEGDCLSLDGHSGTVYSRQAGCGRGKAHTVPPRSRPMEGAVGRQNMRRRHGENLGRPAPAPFSPPSAEDGVGASRLAAAAQGRRKRGGRSLPPTRDGARRS